MLPESFLDSLAACPGMDREAFLGAHAHPAPISIRIHPLKVKNCADLPELSSRQTAVVDWCPHGYYLNERPSFTLDPMFHAGAYYVQEASSMFIHHAAQTVLGTTRGAIALDLCASPGGKATLLSTLPQLRYVLANEIIQSRIPALAENAVRWGTEKLLISNNDPQSLERLGAYFDLVLVDAPCSGSGLFRKDPAAIEEWNTELPGFCSARQQRILASAMKIVKEGGYLIYSTCSYSQCENEENVDFILDSGEFQSIDVHPDPAWEIVVAASPRHNAIGYRFYPHHIMGEGFFCAAFQRTAPGVEMSTGSSNSLSIIKNKSSLSPWVTEKEGRVVFQWQDRLYLQAEENLSDLQHFRQQLRLKRSGISLGGFKRDDFIPDHELALSLQLGERVRRLELDLPTAVHYLKKETIELADQQDGWACVTFAHLPLGWVKIVQGRCKNYYPMSSRILMRS